MGNVWDVIKSLAKYDGNPDAHGMVMDTIRNYGHTLKSTDAWCTESVMAALYDADAIDAVGGFAADSGSLKKHAKGMWHEGTSGILPGDIVLYGKNGKTDHTEIAIGSALNISGNYSGGMSRRKRAGRSIVGYVRPKYAKMPEMDDAQITACAANVILGLYGSGTTREKMLSVFGKENAAAIQAKVDEIAEDADKAVFALAILCIMGLAGKDSYRRKVLGSWADAVQEKINHIWSLRGKSDEDAARDVINREHGSKAVRRLLLAFCGYDADKVQACVNKLLEEPVRGEKGILVSLFRDAPRKSKDEDGLQGNCIILKDMEGSALIIDTMKKGATDKIIAEITDCKNAVLYLSHVHSDHTGNAEALAKAGVLKTVFLQKQETVHNDYLSRYKRLLSTFQKCGIEVKQIGEGELFKCGSITGGCLFQQKSDSVNMASLCTLFRLRGVRILYCGDHHTGTKESKLGPVNPVDILISSHHQLYTGDKEEFVKMVKPQWIIGAGWKSWPLGTVGQDAKVKAAQNVYQKYGNLLPGDVCGRTQLTIWTDGTITANAERNMEGIGVTYRLIDGTTKQAIAHHCTKTKFVKVPSMAPEGGILA